MARRPSSCHARLPGLSHRPKVVWTKHNDHSITSFGNVLRARLATDHVISVSSFVKSMVDNSPYAALPQTVIRHGIDTRRFSPADASDRNAQRRALFGDDHHDLIVFGSTGGTDYDKGWLDLLAAVSKLPAHQRGRGGGGGCAVVAGNSAGWMIWA